MPDGKEESIEVEMCQAPPQRSEITCNGFSLRTNQTIKLSFDLLTSIALTKGFEARIYTSLRDPSIMSEANVVKRPVAPQPTVHWLNWRETGQGISTESGD
jgi:hypothetical protein